MACCHPELPNLEICQSTAFLNQCSVLQKIEFSFNAHSLHLFTTYSGLNRGFFKTTGTRSKNLLLQVKSQQFLQSINLFNLTFQIHNRALNFARSLSNPVIQQLN